MLSFSHMAKVLEKLIIDNSPTILTGIGVMGTAATAYLTHKATTKSMLEIVEEETKRSAITKEPPTTSMEEFKLTWKNYIPPVAVGAATIAAIICANRISVRRAVALAAAYKLSEKNFQEYEEKVKEKLGIKQDQKIKDEIAQKRVDENPSLNRQIIITGNGEVMCYDMLTGRYFKSTMESIRKAENDINQVVIREDYATLSDFYYQLHLPPTPYSEEVGWTITDKLLEVEYSTTMSDDGQPCIAIGYKVVPIRGSKQQDGEDGV